MSDLATAIAIANVWTQPERWRNLAIAVQAWRDAKQQRDEHLQICGRDEYAIMLHQTVEEYRKQILGLRDEFKKVRDYLRNNYYPNLITALPVIDWLNYEPGREEAHANQMLVVFNGLLAREAEAMNAGDRQTPPAGHGEATELAESVGETGTPTKTKRSTERGEARAKLIAALTKHHQYADGVCLNQEPTGNNELARLAHVAKRTASAFFDKEFHGHSQYKILCRDRQRLVAALKLLNGEYSPYFLYGSSPPQKPTHQDDDEQ